MNIDWGILMNVICTGFFTSATAVLGVIPVMILQNPGQKTKEICSISAAGIMVAVSLHIMSEAYEKNLNFTIFGFIFGAIFVIVSKKILSRYEDLEFADLKGSQAQQIILFMCVMSLDAISEGIAQGVSMAAEGPLTWQITVMLSIHNIPEGMVVAMLLLPNGVSFKKTCFLTFLSSFPQTLTTIPAFLLVTHFKTLLPFGLALAAGAMITVGFKEMLGKTEKCSINEKLTISSISAILFLVVNESIEVYTNPQHHNHEH